MWSVRIPFDSTGTSNNGRPGPNSMQTGSLRLKNMKNGSPRLRQMPGSSSAQTPRFFESYLAGVLAETEWPRETLVAFEVKPELSAVLLDVDLAEIEDFPDKIYGVNARARS